MKKLVVPAAVERLEEVNAFVDGELRARGCSARVQMQLGLVVEEIFVNIAHYAYAPGVGEAEISMDVSGDPPAVKIRFLDHGRPFDPLEKEDADTALPAEERKIGGLGILLVKKNVDDVRYSYQNGANILTIQKKL